MPEGYGPKVPQTAATNGRDEFYVRAFIASLADAELRYVVLHECYHKMYQHLTTWKELFEKNPKVAGIACDYVINLKISDENTDGFAKIPTNPDGTPFGYIDEKYRGMNSKQVFNLLMQDAKNQEQRGEAGAGQGSEAGEGQGKPGYSDGGFDVHDWEAADKLSEQEKRDLKKGVSEALRQGSLLASKMGSGGDRDIAELLDPQVDWTEVLREYVTTTCSGGESATYRRPNRRYIGSGVYLPSTISEKVGEIVVAIDMSGSISQDDVNVFMTEFNDICTSMTPEVVRVLYWDTKIVRSEVYRDAEVADCIKTTKPEGGGGTDVSCVQTWLRDNQVTPQIVLVFTDGFLGGDWGRNWGAPLLWLIKGNERAVPDEGKFVFLKEEL